MSDVMEQVQAILPEPDWKVGLVQARGDHAGVQAWFRGVQHYAVGADAEDAARLLAEIVLADERRKPPLADETVSFPVEIVEQSAEPLDAEFFEPAPEALDDLTDEPLLEFGGEMAEHEAEAETPTGQDRFIGLDDLDRRRSLRIGDVVRASIAKQAAIWAEAGATETEYYDLLNQVMRDTQGGLYSGPSEPYERFVAIQGYANRAAAVRSAEHAKVAFLNDASREQVEAFDPETDWP